MRIAVTLGRQLTSEKKSPKQMDYVRSLLNAGARPEEIVEIRPGDVPQGTFDGLLLGGGSDVAPERYGQERLPNADLELDEERDDTEFPLLENALRDGAPILGICRGMQVVNVGLGGTLVQDLPSQRPSDVVHEDSGKDRTNRIHSVNVFGGTRLSEIAGVAAVERPADGLVVSAKGPDGVIEAIEARDGRWLVAVQWHPENLTDDTVSQNLFREFVSEVRRRKG